ncbi:MAG: IS630 family transposase [Acidobacteriota bacterium]
MKKGRIVIAPPERRELNRRIRGRKIRAEDAKRARLILLLARGESYSSICEKLGCSTSFISRWKTRFLKDRLAGLYPRYRGSELKSLTPQLEARILSLTRKTPPDGSTHWSTRRLAKHLGINHMLVHRAWKRAGYSPHRLERYVASKDPDFEAKALDVIGLYLNPPQNALVFCVDEKTAIQALDRTLPVLPLSPGRAERHGFEYKRNGTLSLLAALDVHSGHVHGKTVGSHTSAEFVAFLEDLVAHQPKGQEIHVIADNLSTHKTKRVRDFLAQHPSVQMHYTPTHASWLNQIEIWFSKLKRDVLARGIFKSVNDLDRKILKFIREHNKTASPYKWTYRDVSKRIAHSDSTVTAH